MLSASFFFSVFASVVWIFYVLSNNSQGNVDGFVITTAVVVLPIFILWAVFGYIYQYISASVLNKNMYSLFKQMKKNQDYSDLMAKVLLEAGDSIKDNIVLSKFDIFISDMNELLADIIARSGLAGPVQVDDLWIKVKNGGKWAFGKAVVEVAQSQPNLPNRLLQKALSDAVLGGTILEFCSRYQSLTAALEKHDKERLFLNMLESGVFGKVFSLLAAPADSIRQNRDLTLARRQMEEVKENARDVSEPVRPLPASLVSDKEEEKEVALSESARRLFINTFTRKKPEPEVEKQEDDKDPLSLAFAKSFGAVKEEEPHFEPSFEEEEPVIEPEEDNDDIPFIEEPVIEEEPVVSEEKEEDISFSMPEIVLKKEDDEPQFSVVKPEMETAFSSVGSRVHEIRREWESAKQRDMELSAQAKPEEDGMPEPKIDNDSEFSYPFGGWMNADNYDK